MAENHEIVIQFGKSRSKYYDKAVATARQIARDDVNASYQQSGTGKDVTHQLTLTSLHEAERMWDIIERWKSAHLIIDGKYATEHDLEQLQWQNTAPFTIGCLIVIIMLALFYGVITGDWEGVGNWMSR